MFLKQSSRMMLTLFLSLLCTSAIALDTTDSAGDCVDHKEQCPRLGIAICFDPNYEKFVKENCCKTCSLYTTLPSIIDPHTKTLITTGSSVCVDHVTNCASYGVDVCTAPLFIEWAVQKCKKTCNLCNGVVTGLTSPGTTTSMGITTMKPSTGSGGCVDKEDNCAAYGIGACTTYPQWSADHCSKFCNLCSGSGGCVDKDDNCAAYGIGACTTYPQWAADHCSKYCNLCQASITTTMIATTTTTTAGPTLTTKHVNLTACGDKLTNCRDFGQNICTENKYAQWTRENCAKHCNMCSVGCYHNGTIYKQSEEFKEDCRLKCKCQDAVTGKFTCTSMCFTWQLPSICTLQPPKPGKCCSTPSCPDNVHIQYPDGYTEE